jgi:hypothetical protein
MLELRRLLIRPWESTAGGAGASAARVREIRDPETGRAVGFVSAPAAGGGWWRWLTRPALEVRESEDASLLCTVSRAWALAPRWEVRDAEGRRLGLLDEYSLSPPGAAAQSRVSAGTDACGAALAQVLVLQPVPGSYGREVVLPPLHQLVTVSRTTEGTLVAFAPAGVDNPFARMLVLAAILTADQAAP